jgi:hypothetical protein
MSTYFTKGNVVDAPGSVETGNFQRMKPKMSPIEICPASL